MLFFATTVNYLDRQVLSLTWDEFIKPEFHWNEEHYGNITSVFSIFYAICMLFAGRFVEWMGTKKGFLWAIGVWSVGACLHAVCGLVTEASVGLSSAAELAQATGDVAVVVATISMYCFLVARCVLALGEAGNFPAAIKATAEYFPKKDRAYATSIFNAGASIGALFAPLSIPPLAKYFGWEMAFIIIGVLGFIWMGFWVFLYDKPAKSRFVSPSELEYIEQDKHEQVAKAKVAAPQQPENKIPFLDCFAYKQTWAFAVGKFMTDGVWWFFLFWTPSYLNMQFGIKTSDGLGMALIFTLYAVVTVLSIFGGKLPTIFINRSGQNPYAARMRAMLIFAFFPLLVLLAQPLGMQFAGLGQNAAWIPVLLISMGCAAHQAWSANLFSTIGDMFPKGAIATITGIGGMAGGVGSMILQKSAGNLFVHAGETNMHFLGFEGKPAGYFVIFCICAVAYLIGWSVMKTLVPKYKPIVV
jgi:ACS family hexuronate transporter-like MFS transporter